jgi:hypothetical protein
VEAGASHVVIVGGQETEEGLLVIVLDEDRAIPLFDSLEEAEEFLTSTGNFGEDWHAREVSASELIELLDYQPDEIEYVALSPPPERLEGGMEVQLLYREILTNLLRRRAAPESKGFWRRLLGL